MRCWTTSRRVPPVRHGSGQTPKGPVALEAPGTEDANPAEPKRTVVAKPPLRDTLLVVGDEPGAVCEPASGGERRQERRHDRIAIQRRAVERPIVVSNIRLGIRAAQGYVPVVAFRPEPNADPVKYPSSMVSVAGGQLNVSGVHWELDLPRNGAAEWALFETRGAELLQFQRSTFTIRNASLGQTAYHDGVAFFDIKAPLGAVTMSMDPTAMDESLVLIDLQNCVARGEASLVRDNELQAARLTWNNGLLATSERLLTASGGPSQPRQLGHVQINLRHVTARVHGGLALLSNSEDAPYQLLTEIKADDSICVSAFKPPLIEQRGSDRIEEYLTRFQWSGDHDYFDGFETFWQIVNTSSDATSRQLHFEEWQDFWRRQARSQQSGPEVVVWRSLPSGDRPFHSHRRATTRSMPERPPTPRAAARATGWTPGC